MKIRWGKISKRKKNLEKVIQQCQKTLDRIEEELSKPEPKLTPKDLEPFTESYPEYGQDGELQMIRLRWDEDLIIKYDRLDILPNPRTDLILKEEITK